MRIVSAPRLAKGSESYAQNAVGQFLNFFILTPVLKDERMIDALSATGNVRARQRAPFQLVWRARYLNIPANIVASFLHPSAFK